MHIGIVFITCLAHNASMCLLARDGRTMPSANSAVVVVESQRRGNRRYVGPPLLKGVAPRMHIIVLSRPHSSCGAKTLLASSL